MLHRNQHITIALNNKNGRLRSSIEINGQTIEVRFSFEQEESKANRKAGDLLVASGLARRSKELIFRTIAFGYERPLEKLLISGLEIGGRKLTTVLSRISPTRASYLGKAVKKIDDADEIEEIVVTATNSQKIKYKTEPYIVLGKDWLGNCEKVRVLKKPATMELYCK